MNKIQPIYALLITLFLLYAFSSNPPTGRTGAPNEGNCTDCHTPNNSGFAGMVALKGLPDLIQPNTTYNISITTTVTMGSPTRSGFEMVILDEAANNSGTFSNVDNNSNIADDSGRSYLRHRSALNFNGIDSVVWRADWTSPANLPTDSIKIYIVSNIANGSGSAGDLIVSNRPTFAFEAPPVEPIIIEITSTNDVSCFGESDGSITANASVGTGNITYQWSNNATTASISNLSIGTYLVTATDADGTTATASATINQPNLLTIAVGNVTNIDCTNAIGSATASASGGTAPFTFNWSTNESGATVNLAAGDHTVTVVDDHQCTTTTMVTITEDTRDPIAFAGFDLTITCADDNMTSVQLDAFNSSTGTGVTYLWTTADGNIVSGATTLMPVVDASGTYVLTVSTSANGCTASDSASVVFDTTPPVANAGDTKQIDCNNVTATLDGSGSSQGDDFAYNWTTTDGDIMSGGTTLMPIVSSSGTYILAVRDTSNSCIATDSVSVTQDESMPTADAGPDTQLGCDSDTLIVVGTGSMGDNITYSWTTANGMIIGSDTTLGVMIVGAGTYTLTVLDGVNSCSVSSSIIISDMILPVANAGTTAEINCANPTLVLDASASTGDNLEYAWTTIDGNIVDNANMAMPTVDAAGIYSLTVTNSITGCTASASVTITESEITELFAASGDADQLTCAQTSLTLNANASEGENIIYEWTTEGGNIVSGGNTLTPVIDAPGAYILSVRDTVNGCVGESAINIAQDINLPIVNAGDSLTLDCNTPSLSLSGSSETMFNLTYSWTTSDGNIVSGGNTPNPIVDAAGTYTLTLVDTFTNCAASASVSIGQDEEVPMTDAGMTLQLDCNNDTLTLNGSGSTGDNFITTWSTTDGNILEGASTFAPMVDAVGIYSLTVTDTTSGCSSTATVAVIMDTEKPMVDAGAGEQFLCGDGTLIIEGTASMGDDFTYFWCTSNGNIITGADAPTVEISGAGLFEFIVTNTTNGCSNVDTVIITAVEGIELSLDTMSAGSATVSVAGGTAPYSYIWNTDSMDTEATVSGLLAGDYQVTATDNNGCQDALTVTIELSTGISELDKALESLQLFPNPTSTHFEIAIDFNTLQKGEIFIINKVGQQMWQKQFEDKNLEYQVEVNDWSAGIYYMVVRTANGVKTEEIVVVR